MVPSLVDCRVNSLALVKHCVLAKRWARWSAVVFVAIQVGFFGFAGPGPMWITAATCWCLGSLLTSLTCAYCTASAETLSSPLLPVTRHGDLVATTVAVQWSRTTVSVALLVGALASACRVFVVRPTGPLEEGGWLALRVEVRQQTSRTAMSTFVGVLLSDECFRGSCALQAHTAVQVTIFADVVFNKFGCIGSHTEF